MWWGSESRSAEIERSDGGIGEECGGHVSASQEVGSSGQKRMLVEEEEERSEEDMVVGERRNGYWRG